MGDSIRSVGARPPPDDFSKRNIKKGKLEGNKVSIIKSGAHSFGKHLKKTARNAAAETAAVAIKEFGIHFMKGDADDWRVQANTARLLIKGETNS